MGGRTYRYYNFREYEGGAFSRYLEEMAGKGWYNKAVHAAESGASLNSSTLGQIKIRSSLILCGCSSRQFGAGQRGQLERPAVP